MRWSLILLITSAVYAAPVAEANAEAVPVAAPAPTPAPNSNTNKQALKCSFVRDLVTAFREQNKATKFCASWLHTSTANGCTTTVKKTETKYVTTTVNSANTGTTTETAPAVTTTATAYVTKYETKYETKTETSVTGTTTEYAAITCGPIGGGGINKRSPQPHLNRVATQPKPQCFNGWNEKGVISSACKCLSITATTATVTSYTTTTKTSTVTLTGNANTVTVTPTTTAGTAYVTKYETKYETKTQTTYVNATVTRPGTLQTPAAFKVFAPATDGGSTKYAMSANPAASVNGTAISQLKRVLFSANGSPGIFQFNATSRVREIATERFFVALNTTSNVTGNITTGGGSNNNTNGTAGGGSNNGTMPDSGVKLVSDVEARGLGNSLQYLSCTVVPVVIGNGFACQLKCTAYTTRTVNQLTSDSAWVLNQSPDPNLTTFTTFIEAVSGG